MCLSDCGFLFCSERELDGIYKLVPNLLLSQALYDSSVNLAMKAINFFIRFLHIFKSMLSLSLCYLYVCDILWINFLENRIRILRYKTQH